jgi:hypothetical protein
MGIAYSLIRVAPETVAALKGRPRVVADFVYGDPDFYEAPKLGIIARLLGRKASEDTAPVPKRRDDDEIDLDKAWHIIHYLLTGCVERADGPLGLIADDLHPLADIDLGLGRPNIVSEDAVRLFADSSEALTDADFLARYVPEEIPAEDLYLGNVIQRGDHDDIKEYALENFRLLRAFARQAADNGEAIITYYS